MKSLEVKIERILPGGQGLAHAEGLTLFVPLTAPGDIVRIEVNRIKGRSGFGTVRAVLEPSPARVEPPCPYFGRCGGCDFQQLSYPAQLEAKAEIIRDCLFRIARIEEPPSIHVTPSPREWHYRSRASWRFDPEHRRFGYYEGGTHEVCDVEFCAVLAPELESVFEAVRRAGRNGTLENQVREIEAACGDDGVSVRPAVVGFSTVEVSRGVANESYRYDVQSFFQINDGLLEELIRQAIPAESPDNSLALDLYCGVGLFTLPLARLFKKVIGVEANAGTTRFAKLNLQAAGLENVQIETARVGDWLLKSNLPHVSFAVVDPPRTGVEPSVIEGFLRVRPDRVSYVSCDPATLARDLRLLIAGGYSVDNVTALDMFPQTHHVETVTHLSIN